MNQLSSDEYHLIGSAAFEKVMIQQTDPMTHLILSGRAPICNLRRVDTAFEAMCAESPKRDAERARHTADSPEHQVISSSEGRDM